MKTIIHFGNASFISVFGGMNISLRAADNIVINEGFEVDEYSEFLADVIGGCDEGY